MTSVSPAGYYYDLDDSYDESDEDEVRAHLRRVAEQPPLKLDDSTEVKHLSTHRLIVLCIHTDDETLRLFPPPHTFLHRNWTFWECLA